MKVSQVYELMNNSMKEVLGQETVIEEDLSNVIDLGKAIIDENQLDNYVKSLVNHIGKVIFQNRLYRGNVPSVLMDKWEFGSVMEKVTADIPDATESDTWKLENGKEYSQDVFYQPKVDAKFYNSRVTFEVPLSFTEKQVKESFSNASQLNGFLSMLQTTVENSMTVKLDNLIMKTINNMTAEVLSGGTDVQKVNLLATYNTEKGANLTKDQALKDSEFIKYASYMVSIYKDRISKISTLFNAGKKPRFTPETELHLVLLSDFAKASDVYLSSNTFHEEKVALPKYETVPYWQGSGLGYGFEDVSKINVTTKNKKKIEQSGIIGVMFDTQALGISNLDQRVTSSYNAKAEFYTNYNKMDAGYYNDLNENFVVFYMEEVSTEEGK